VRQAKRVIRVWNGYSDRLEAAKEVVVMELTGALVLIGALILLGFVIGSRVEEHNLQLRERELARARRELTDTARTLDV
jgi:hypothetical protein